MIKPEIEKIIDFLIICFREKINRFINVFKVVKMVIYQTERFKIIVKMIYARIIKLFLDFTPISVEKTDFYDFYDFFTIFTKK